jgi:four helix bundle protein
MSDFRKLRVWHAARRFAVEAHRLTRKMRAGRGVTTPDQLRRSSASVPSTIVEGCAHESVKEFARYLRYSIASVSESEGHVQLALDLGMISQREYDSLVSQIVDIRKMQYGLLKRLESDDRYGDNDQYNEPDEPTDKADSDAADV